MPLSIENMETTDRQLDHSKIFRDIARMDEGQLGKYVGMTFQREQDFSFLPRTFWSGYFDMYAEGFVERGLHNPARFFSDMYIIVGKVKEGTYRVNGEAPDEIFRPRFETAINTITNGLLSQEEEPTEKQLRLASSINETVGWIRLTEGPDSFEEKFGEVKRLQADPRFAKARWSSQWRIDAEDQILGRLKDKSMLPNSM